MADHSPDSGSGASRLLQQLRYRFDNTMSRGTPALIGWLTLVCLIIVVPASAALVWADKHTPTTLGNQLKGVWQNVGETFGLGSAVGTPAYVLLSVLLALVALFFASTLVGLITAGVQRKIMDLRQGRSVVLEKRHIVVLGWSGQVFPIVSELTAAEANQRGSVVAILADRDKIQMEEAIRTQVPDTKGTRIICRTGDPGDPAVIRMVNPETARAVIVIAQGDLEPAVADAEVIRTLLALNSGAGQTTNAHVVASVRDPRNRRAAELAAGEHGWVVNLNDAAARIIVQTARQPGLSLVYARMLEFAGDEFYTLAEPALVGRPFGEALLAYDTSSVLGLLHADGSVALNPPSDAAIAEDDLLIVVTRDDDTAVLAEQPAEVDEGAIVAPRPRPAVPERLLLLGWNQRARSVVELLAESAAEGSAIDIVAHGDRAAAESALLPPFPGVECRFRPGETFRPEVLADLDLGSYDSLIVLGYDVDDEAGASSQSHPDVDTLVTLLHLRALEAELGCELRVVTEMAKDSNRVLAPVTAGADFIVSDKVISQLLAQISENLHLGPLFRELGNAQGCEIYLKPATDYVAQDREISYATAVESARRQGECALGYRLSQEAATAPDFGLRLNPDKRSSVTLSTGDSLVLVSRQ
ncbi:CASTOR/POLLUX-related putative ion channel [Streptomyces boninensis]|uniref:CASTOR/POLLUX-related putative ion channel n=1 Tax=Streptomyces boninensis TaxID=2039455 RepID=UPI003B22333D